MFSRFSTMFNNVRSPSGGGTGRGRRGPGDDIMGDETGGRGRGMSPSEPSSSKKSRSAEENEEDKQLCQVDNSKAVIAKIATLYAERLMSDIILVINKTEYPAHRLLLCASSDVFHCMLMNCNFNEAKESRVVLQESIECAQVFENFLKYLYIGRLKLEISSVLHVLILADKYNVKDLIDLCLTYMQMHIPAAAHKSQLIRWFQYTSSFAQVQGLQHGKVAECCRNYIKWNLELVCKSEDFFQLELDLFVSILKEDDLVISDEFLLYQIAEYWLMSRIEKSSESSETSSTTSNNTLEEDEFISIINRVMTLIRFPMMTPRQIADLIPSLLVRNCKSLMDNMAVAMKFHNGCLDNMMDIDDNPIPFPPTYTYLTSPRNPLAKFFTPRNYSTDKWSVNIVAPFQRMSHYQAQTLVFTTPCSFSDCVNSQDNKQVEWCLDFYPKAVQFQKLMLIGWQRTTEIPEHILKTVRLSILCHSEEAVRVHIGVLIAGYQDGIEHVRKVIGRNYIFSDKDKILNLDDLLPYGDLNPCAHCATKARNQNQTAQGQSLNPNNNDGEDLLNETSRRFQLFPTSTKNGAANKKNQYGQELNSCASCEGAPKSCFFIGGENQLELKIRIVITPLP